MYILLSLFLFYFFFFYCYADHRDLHSFPTRRSSDLWFRDLGEIFHFKEVSALEAELAGKHVIRDRKSTRLNSSHVAISYAVFCLKKKTPINSTNQQQKSHRI